MNFFKIQWNHLMYKDTKDTFCYSAMNEHKEVESEQVRQWMKMELGMETSKIIGVLALPKF